MLEWGRTWHPAGLAAGMLAEHVGQPTHGWKCSQLHICWTVEKCCHQLNKGRGKRESRSGKLREDCCSILKSTSTKIFLKSILEQFCSDWFYYQLSTFGFTKYHSIIISYEALNFLISIQHIVLGISYCTVCYYLKNSSYNSESNLCNSFHKVSSHYLPFTFHSFSNLSQGNPKPIFISYNLHSAYTPLQFMQNCLNTANKTINSNTEQ